MAQSNPPPLPRQELGVQGAVAGAEVFLLAMVFNSYFMLIIQRGNHA